MSPDIRDDAPRRSRKQQRTADHLVSAAFALFEEHGYDAVTMEQIAAAADVAKGTLYNHFPVKEALVRHRLHADLAEALPTLFAALPDAACCAERLGAFMAASAHYSLKNRDYLPHYIRYRLGRPLSRTAKWDRSGMHQVFQTLLAEGQAAGEITGRIPAEVLAEMLQFLHLATLLRWCADPDLDLRLAFQDMLKVFLHGCTTDGAK